MCEWSAGGGWGQELWKSVTSRVKESSVSHVFSRWMMTLTVHQKSSGRRGQRGVLWGGWGISLRVHNVACSAFHWMGIFHASMYMCVCTCFWRQLKACGQFSQSDTLEILSSIPLHPISAPVRHPRHKPSGPAGGCRGIVALWPYHLSQLCHSGYADLHTGLGSVFGLLVITLLPLNVLGWGLISVWQHLSWCAKVQCVVPESKRSFLVFLFYTKC